MGGFKSGIERSIYRAKVLAYRARMAVYNSIFVPLKVRSIRRKQEIKVLFLVSELGPWKTERLYLMMKEHPRFVPVLGLFTSPEIPGARLPLEQYCRENGYDYVDLDRTDMKSLRADIIFHQKPYPGCYPADMQIERHLYALFCYVRYAFHGVNAVWSFNQRLFHYAWQIYYENIHVAEERKPLVPRRGKNIVVTGLPIQDSLTVRKSDVADPWKDRSGRKRIIYAPHHTIAGMHMEGIGFSTFLNYCDFMLDIAEKYKEKVCFAFKPHPRLYKNLLAVWGKERTEVYYRKWQMLENGQMETGAYTGLFMHSDAMIHDCSSFTIEYHYTHNPVLYLTKDDHHGDSLSVLSRKAFDLHYKAADPEGIELFIQNVIKGVDPLKPGREKFFTEFLLPPHGKTACENIIHSILGEEEYK